MTSFRVVVLNFLQLPLLYRYHELPETNAFVQLIM